MQLGGDLGSTEETQRDFEAAFAEGKETVPRGARAWLSLTYEADPSGELVSPSTLSGATPTAVGLRLTGTSASKKPRPFDGDGSRAVAALAWQVRRARHVYAMLCVLLHGDITTERAAES